MIMQSKNSPSINIYCLHPDDLEPNSLAVIPGMGIPEQLKIAMEQEQMGK